MTRMIEGPRSLLAVSERGSASEAPSIVFLHGDSGALGQWDAVCDRLVDHAHLIRFDFRGHGGSPAASDGDYSNRARAEDVLAVLEACDVERCVLVAHSGAAPVALTLAGDERVVGILLIDPATDPELIPTEVREGMIAALAGPDGAEAVKAYYRSIAGDDPTVVAQITADIDRTDPAARVGVAKALTSWQPRPLLSGIDIPVRVVASAVTDNPGAVHLIREDIAHVVIPGVSHWIQIEKPDVVADAVRSFLTELG